MSLENYEEYDALYFRQVSDKSRQALADKGHAMPDGSFPIANRGDLENAVKAFGRAKDPEAVKRFIKRRARELGAEDVLPASWGARQKNMSDGELFSLNDVEVFAAGHWNVGTPNEAVVTVQDLDDMAAAAGEMDFRPPLKQGHMKDKPGMPALGYVEGVRRVGEKLYANLVDMPKVVYDAIARKSYNGVSAEVWEGLKRGNKTFAKALKAVALLGADIPAVAGLAPLSSLFDGEGCAFRVFEFRAEDDEMTPQEKEQLEELQKKVKAYEDQHTADKLELDQANGKIKTLEGDLDTTKTAVKLLEQSGREADLDKRAAKVGLPALQPVVRQLYEVALGSQAKNFAVGDNKEAGAVDVVDALVTQLNDGTVAKLFKQSTKADDPGRREYVESGRQAAGVAIHEKVTEYQAQHPETDYTAALHSVLAANPELKAQYGAKAH